MINFTDSTCGSTCILPHDVLTDSVRRLVLSLCLPLALLTIVPTAVAQGQNTASASRVGAVDAVTLQPGDVVHISVWRKPELSGEFPIAANGAIGDPFYGDVIVGGLPLDEARVRIRNHIARIEADPLVWVEPMLRVVVMGEVRQPNLYPVRYPTTVAQAIAQAGGPTELARLDRVQLVRAGTAQTVDLRHPTSLQARAVLQSGDEIIVPRRSTAFRDSLVPISTLASIAALVVTITNR